MSHFTPAGCRRISVKLPNDPIHSEFAVTIRASGKIRDRSYTIRPEASPYHNDAFDRMLARCTR